MSKVSRVLVTYKLIPPSLLQKLQATFDHVDYLPPQSGGADHPDLTDEVYRQAQVLWTFHLPHGLQDYSQTPNLTFLQCAGAGTEHILNSKWYASIPKDVPFTLANSSGIHTQSMGEHVLMGVLMLQHQQRMIDNVLRHSKRWMQPPEYHGLYINEVRGSTWGILAYGHLGREIARLGSCLGARIVACTRDGQPRPVSGWHIAGTSDEQGTLPEQWYRSDDETQVAAFLKECDVVISTMPSLPSTQNFISAAKLQHMKPTAIFVNVGRGTTVQTDDLVAALSPDTTGPKIAGAVLDVTNPEVCLTLEPVIRSTLIRFNVKPLPDGHPLFSMENVILTPHSSWASVHNFSRAFEVLEANKDRLEQGLEPLNLVNMAR